MESDGAEALAARARAVIDGNAYMVLGTADGDGRPWVAPVFYAARAHRELYWISAPEVAHSRNIAVRPEVSVVVFDSRRPVGGDDMDAVYMSATAEELSGSDVEEGLETYPGPHYRGEPMTPDRLRAPRVYRLYRATVSRYWMICPREAGEPCKLHGRAYEHRAEVHLTGGA